MRGNTKFTVKVRGQVLFKVKGWARAHERAVFLALDHTELPPSHLNYLAPVEIWQGKQLWFTVEAHNVRSLMPVLFDVF